MEDGRPAPSCRSGRYCVLVHCLTSSASMVMDTSSPAMAGAPFTPKSFRLIFVVADAPM